jgi:hypothetical protein
MNPPEWMRDWRESLLTAPPEIAIDLGVFRAGQAAPRRVKEATPAINETVERGLPSLTARVGRRLAGEGLACGFRIDLYRDGEHARSLAVAWRRDPGTFIVLRCARDAATISDGVNWVVEIQVGDQERREGPLIYQALYSHLNDGGHALAADDVGRVRNVVRSLDGLGLDLEPAEVDPRRRPRLITPGASMGRWLEEVVKTVIARMMCAGLLGSKRWAEEARTLVNWPDKTFAAYAHAWSWRGTSAVREAALERDLCGRFQRWAQGNTNSVRVVSEDRDGVLWRLVDGQRPDLRVEEGDDVAVIEAKLGLTRDSVRTGIAQSQEYAFHLHSLGHRWPVLLLLGEPPEYHGHRFAEYVRDTAGRLGIGVLVERGATDFMVWRPAPRSPEHGPGSGLVGWFCRGGQ